MTLVLYVLLLSVIYAECMCYVVMLSLAMLSLFMLYVMLSVMVPLRVMSQDGQCKQGMSAAVSSYEV